MWAIVCAIVFLLAACVNIQVGGSEANRTSDTKSGGLMIEPPKEKGPVTGPPENKK